MITFGTLTFLTHSTWATDAWKWIFWGIFHGCDPSVMWWYGLLLTLWKNPEHCCWLSLWGCRSSSSFNKMAVYIALLLFNRELFDSNLKVCHDAQRYPNSVPDPLLQTFKGHDIMDNWLYSHHELIICRVTLFPFTESWIYSINPWTPFSATLSVSLCHLVDFWPESYSWHCFCRLWTMLVDNSSCLLLMWLCNQVFASPQLGPRVQRLSCQKIRTRWCSSILWIRQLVWITILQRCDNFLDCSLSLFITFRDLVSVLSTQTQRLWRKNSDNGNRINYPKQHRKELTGKPVVSFWHFRHLFHFQRSSGERSWS